MNPTETRINEHACQAIHDEIVNADIAFQANGTPHAEFLHTRRHHYKGQARREIERICRLRYKAVAFINVYLKEFDV